MKKNLIMIILSVFLSVQLLGDIMSNIGFGIGLGVPTGLEAKVVYRQNRWLSYSLNYNRLAFDLDETLSDDNFELDVSADIVSSTPGIMAHFHPFGGNLRTSLGFVWDLGGINVGANGTISEGSIDLDVDGNISFKLGDRYPYLGLAYGYSYKSKVRLEFGLGAYLIKNPSIKVSLGTTASSAETFIDSLVDGGSITTTQANEMKNLLEAYGYNILDIARAYEEATSGGSLGIPNTKEIEDEFNDALLEALELIPKIGSYTPIPIISIGFTVFLF